MRGLLVCLVSLALAGCAGDGTTPNRDGSGAIVLVSGRDDHGLLQLPEVPLYVQPEATEITAHVPDGEFAEVLEVRGTWLQIRSIADPASVGWIDDFFLRDRAVLHNVQQVRFLAARVGGGGSVEVEVRAIQGDGAAQWVGEDHLDEVGADIDPHEH